MHIGKEADRWEEDELFGADEDSVTKYGFSSEDRDKAIATIRQTLESCTHFQLARSAKVSEHTIAKALQNDPHIRDETLAQLLAAANSREAKAQLKAKEEAKLLAWVRGRVAQEGRNAIARHLGQDSGNLGKVLSGKRSVGKKLLRKLTTLRKS
jgi:hypothetical protein